MKNEESRVVPLKWNGGEVIGVARVWPNGRIVADVVNKQAIALFNDSLVGLSFTNIEAKEKKSEA